MDESQEPYDDSLSAIIDELTCCDSRLPVEAIEAARLHRVEITPLLIELIEEAAQDCRKGLLVEDNGHLFATYLLAEFQATEAWPAVREAISLPGEMPFELYEDAITEDFGAIMATLIGDRRGEVDALLGNSEINEYVRWQAVEALKFQVQAGLETREAAIELLAKHLRRGIDERDHTVDGIVLGLDDFGAVAHLPLIEEAFAHDLVDVWSVTLDDIRNSIVRGDELFHETMARLRKPEELISHFQHWAAFQEDEDEESSEDDFSDDPSDWSFTDPYFREPMPLDSDTTIRYESKKIGRNDMCPCGSGKKYKKCCGH